MSDETKDAQKSRAERLHRHIDAIKSGDASPGRSGRPPNPRDWIEKRMRDLDGSESCEDSKDDSASEKGKGRE